MKQGHALARIASLILDAAREILILLRNSKPDIQKFRTFALGALRKSLLFLWGCKSLMRSSALLQDIDDEPKLRLVGEYAACIWCRRHGEIPKASQCNYRPGEAAIERAR